MNQALLALAAATIAAAPPAFASKSTLAPTALAAAPALAAEPTQARVVAAAAAAPAALAPESTLVLVVASNRGAQLDRPPLHYADDDGAKYAQVFAALAGEERTLLLTDFDADSARLFPALAARARPPVRAEIDRAVRELAQQAAAAHRAGGRVRFYFAFAGHGDVDQGRGFLDLADGPFTSDDLAAAVRAVGADEAHVILDSCNSFFVVNPRKPGGRRFATPRDAAESLSQRLPNVGVFLSTSAEAEVFEWSELQSGVFSHAVRSGLLGAADANHDGRITYQELAAFVETAAAEVKNPLFRPKVFARGPNGQDDSTLFQLAGSAGAIGLDVDEPGEARLALRDDDGQRWLDAHKEAGASLRLWIPRALAGQLELTRLGDRAGADRVEASWRIPRTVDGVIAVAALEPAAPRPEPRGAGEIFRALFARPFGPRALAAWIDEKARSPEPVYGVSRQQAERMALLLEQLADSDRESRIRRGALAISGGVAVATYTALRLGDPGLSGADKRLAAGLGFGAAAIDLGVGLPRLLRPSVGEKAYQRFRTGMAVPGGDQAQVVAETEASLQEMLEEERSQRRSEIVGGWIIAGVGATALALGEAAGWKDSESDSRANREMGRFTALMTTAVGAGLALSAHFSTSPTEKLIRVWQSDPELRQTPSLGVSPLPGGGMLSVAGRF